MGYPVSGNRLKEMACDALLPISLVCPVALFLGADATAGLCPAWATCCPLNAVCAETLRDLFRAPRMLRLISLVIALSVKRGWINPQEVEITGQRVSMDAEFRCGLYLIAIVAAQRTADDAALEL